MYILVRADITPGYQIAQAIHAAVEHVRRNPDQYAPTVVALSVPTEDDLLDFADRLVYAGTPVTVFHEPDIDEHTALCAVTDGSMFAQLPLAGGVMV